MNTFQCPKCQAVVKAIASEVSHRCPSAQSKMVEFNKIESDKK